MVRKGRLPAAIGLIALAALGVAALPAPAKAWWRGGVGFGIVVPPVVVSPAPVYVPPPTYYRPPPVVYAPPPRQVWVPPHWNGYYWVPGHWRWG